MLTSPRLTQVTFPRLFCTEDQVQSLEPTANHPLSYPVKKWPTAKMIEIRSWSLLHRIWQGWHEPMHDNGLGDEWRFEEACRTYHSSRRCTTDPAKGQKCWWCRRLAEPWGGPTYGDVPALRHTAPQRREVAAPLITVPCRAIGFWGMMLVLVLIDTPKFDTSNALWCSCWRSCGLRTLDVGLSWILKQMESTCDSFYPDRPAVAS